MIYSNIKWEWFCFSMIFYLPFTDIWELTVCINSIELWTAKCINSIKPWTAKCPWDYTAMLNTELLHKKKWANMPKIKRVLNFRCPVVWLLSLQYQGTPQILKAESSMYGLEAHLAPAGGSHAFSGRCYAVRGMCRHQGGREQWVQVAATTRPEHRMGLSCPNICLPLLFVLKANRVKARK